MSRRSPDLHVCFVCDSSVRANGGTAAYERFLSAEVVKTCPVYAIARYVDVPTGGAYDFAAGEGPGTFEDNGVTTFLLPPRSPLLAPALRRLPSLMARPRLIRWAERLHRFAYEADLDRLVRPGTTVVHYIGTGRTMLGASLAAVCRRRGAALVVTPFVHPSQWGDDRIDVRFYARADAVIVESDYEARHLADRGVSAARMHRVGLGPGSDLVGDGDRFRRSRGLGWRPLVLFIARRQRYKGYHVLREAMADVLRTVPDAALVVIGPDAEPPYPPLPEAAIVDLGTLSWSAEDQQTKADALAACDVLAMPSTAEAFGIVYVEAWSYGKPVIGGPAPAVLELISDGVNGLHVPQERDHVAATLLRLLCDAETSRSIGASGRELQRAEYSWPVVTARTLGVYRAAMRTKA